MITIARIIKPIYKTVKKKKLVYKAAEEYNIIKNTSKNNIIKALKNINKKIFYLKL